jgi:chromosome segregation ATPase
MRLARQSGNLDRRPMASLPDKLDLALVKRLRAVVGGVPATESELRTLADQAGGWARATEAQLRAAEQRLGKLNADPASELSEMATEIRRVETLSEELDEARSLVTGLEERTRELRTAWLKYHADSAPPLNHGS